MSIFTTNHGAGIFDNVATSYYLLTTIIEAQTQAIFYQDPFHLWEISLARNICPHSMYFPEFFTWCSIYYSPNKRIIISSYYTKHLCMVNVDSIKKILCFLELLSLQFLHEQIVSSTYLSLKPMEIIYSLSQLLEMGMEIPIPLHLMI